MARQKYDDHGVSEKEGKAWGKGEYANMPKAEKMQLYPKNPKARDKVLDDTITGIDSWSRQMEGKRDRFVSDQH